MPEEDGEGNEQKLPERSGFIGVGGNPRTLLHIVVARELAPVRLRSSRKTLLTG